MEIREKLQEDITALETALQDPSIPESDKAKMRNKISALQNQISSLPSATTQSAPTESVKGDAIDEALQILRAMMLSAPQGSGVNSDEVNKLIEMYLASKKINLAELDSSVLDYIKANQNVIVTVPSVGLQVEINKADANIPNLFAIMDDVLAGNNIFMIGEAGAGKTYGAERVASILQRERITINCSQYTSPTEVIGGQTIEGYKEGKLIKAWGEGLFLILDEMPRLDPNTAGLFNDALAKSSHTMPPDKAKINSSNPDDAPIPRNNNFALVATGNVYPNTPPTQQYGANFQQDLSLLDRFSGSVYRTEYSDLIDEDTCRYQFIFDMLVGNYYEYMRAKKANQTLPTARGLRTILTNLNHLDKAVISYRTNTAFRIAFEIEMVRAIYYRDNPSADKIVGKTLLKAYESFLVAFSPDVRDTIIAASGFTEDYVKVKVIEAVDKFVKDNGKNWMQTLCPSVKKQAQKILEQTKSIQIADSIALT